ncbi:rhoptry kinase family protein (incomplete catalytic triad) [Besnoitia besnoiti]|uniref:Rhoptry kinase family protein (Incomplete catalytic triad) n=1 Tax=Besnoitia besnoiti TaxID=94643 RepID=A0A2A9MJC6_BESBE|nr:rhoptry kinase family protein (incomplete catalytic triad) [Besnoitia besnoiti]PFH38075.1 rhoptry kinase family protein (incomplete catalytic triad) [Besnoitia besnoiti]
MRLQALVCLGAALAACSTSVGRAAPLGPEGLLGERGGAPTATDSPTHDETPLEAAQPIASSFRKARRSTEKAEAAPHTPLSLDDERAEEREALAADADSYSPAYPLPDVDNEPLLEAGLGASPSIVHDDFGMEEDPESSAHSISTTVVPQSRSVVKSFARTVASPFLVAFGSYIASRGAPQVGWAFVREMLTDVEGLHPAGLANGGKEASEEEAKNQAKRNQSFYWMSLWRWWCFYVGLPELVEQDHQEVEALLPSVKSSSEPVMRNVQRGSAKLAEALGLPPSELARGFTVKVYRLSKLKPWIATTEIFLRKRLLPANYPFFVPLLAARRGAETGTTFQFFPLSRGSLRQVASASPEKLHAPMAMAEMVWAVEALHRLGLIHRALSLDVFYVSRDGHIQLGDFENACVDGVYRPISELPPGLHDGYPRLLRRFNFAVLQTKAVDVYSLGKIFKLLAELTDLAGVERMRLDLLVERMTAKNPELRITMREVRRDKFFEGVDFVAVRGRLNLKVYGRHAGLQGLVVASASDGERVKETGDSAADAENEDSDSLSTPSGELDSEAKHPPEGEMQDEGRLPN